MTDDDEMSRHYAAALDEVYSLRAIAANEARILEAHLDYKTFPKSRRSIAEAQVERLRQAARGDADDVYKQPGVGSRELRALGRGYGTLTRWEWEERHP